MKTLLVFVLFTFSAFSQNMIPTYPVVTSLPAYVDSVYLLGTSNFPVHLDANRGKRVIFGGQVWINNGVASTGNAWRIDIMQRGALLRPAAWFSDTTMIWTAINSKANTSHAHAPNDVTGTAVITNDSRLSDARTPTTHNQVWSTITATPTTRGGYGITDAAASSHTHSPADVTGTAVITSDSRLSDARTPTAHTHLKASITDFSHTHPTGEVTGLGTLATQSGTFSGTSSGTNTGDNAVNSTYASDFRAANFVAGTNYLTPNGSAASLTGFPTLNQNTSGTAAGLSAVLSFANGGRSGVAATSATTGTMTVNMTTAVVTITPTGACTFNASGGVAGQILTFSITTSGTTSFVLTFGTNFRKVGTLATGTTSARFFAVTFICIDGTIWLEISRTAAQT